MSDNPYWYRNDEWWVKPDIKIVPDYKDMEIAVLRNANRDLREKLDRGGGSQRERIAIACLAGILANPELIGNFFEDYADEAVKCADALIARLDAEAKQ